MVGGIMLNCDGEKTDKFVPLTFEIVTKDKTRDCYKEVFGFESSRKYTKENIIRSLRKALR